MVGGATVGLFLSQLLLLSDKGANPEGWVYKSEAEMGKETGLTKREQQTARRKFLALGVVQIVRQGFKFTYHFRIVWERLYQVIQQHQQRQNVPTEKVERIQNVSTEPVQTVATHNRDNKTEKQEREKTARENQTIWDNAVAQVTKDLPVGERADWHAGTTLLAVTETAATVFVPNRTAIAWVERRLYRRIQKALTGVVGRDVDLQFVTSPS
jgi:hypothetical protein